MTWLEFGLVVLNVATLSFAAWRCSGIVTGLRAEIDLYDDQLKYRLRQLEAMQAQGYALRYYANPQAWQSPDRGKHSDAFHDRGNRARDALKLAQKIMEREQ